MRKYLQIEDKELIDLLNNTSNPISYTFMGWQDGDFFNELCKEDGGIIKKHKEIFETMFKNKKINNLDDIISVVIEYQKHPYLHSINGNYKYHYDIHIWFKNMYIVYNAYLKRAQSQKQGLVGRVLSSAVLPDWQRNTTYLEWLNALDEKPFSLNMAAPNEIGDHLYGIMIVIQNKKIINSACGQIKQLIENFRKELNISMFEYSFFYAVVPEDQVDTAYKAWQNGELNSPIS